jgi:hypothetical protein
MFTQGLAHQRGTIPFQPTRGPVGGLQKSLVENNLNRFHMSNMLDSILYIIIASFDYRLPLRCLPGGLCLCPQERRQGKK